MFIMPEVHSKALNQTISVNRIVGRIDGEYPGPCLVFLGGIHGNEPSGLFALHQVLKELQPKQNEFSGTMIAISGNLWALERAVRYHKTDLNRLWSQDKIEALENGDLIPENEDEKQQLEIFQLLNTILKEEEGPFYFFDLHTTSSASPPFITVNDSLLNRKFTQQYPVPLILGIEEYLEGPLLSYINELGYVSFGFEAGQHDALSSVENHKIFIYLSLVFTGALAKNAVGFDHYIDHWNTHFPEHQHFYEVYYRLEVKKKERFVMKPGFLNFQTIKRKEVLATLNEQPIYALKKAIIFMPLYQSQGSDGYFLIRKISPFFLLLSEVLRTYKTDRIFVMLPGVKWASELKDTMVVNLRIARLITKQLFHLFGYRSKQKDRTHLTIKNREYNSTIDDYKEEQWYKDSVFENK